MSRIRVALLLAVALAGAATSASAGGGVSVSIGVGFGPFWYSPYYYPAWRPYPYARPTYHYGPSYYYGPANQVVVDEEPRVRHVERDAPSVREPNPRRYYCAEAQAYYPAVKYCAAGWQKVAPQ